MNREFYISVDVETAGPYPERYSLLSIGACTLEHPRQSFYVELKPVNSNAIQSALDISHLSMSELDANGLEPGEAIAQFESWLKRVVPEDHRPLFVAFNAAFDWMFVNSYFYRYLGRNPFGHAALDVKSFYMALHGVSWAETSMYYVASRYLGNKELTHNALQDAFDQADIFLRMLDAVQTHSKDAPSHLEMDKTNRTDMEVDDE